MGLFDLIDPPRARGGRAARPQLSRPVFPADPTWRVPDELPELHGLVALDGEMKDPGITAGTGSCWPYAGQGYVTGWAISSEQQDLYLPMRHAAGNMDPDRVTRWLAAQAAKPDVTFIYANAMHDLGWMLRDNISPVNLPIDVQAMAALLDEHRFSYSLDSLGQEYLGEGKSDKEMHDRCAAAGLTDPMANMNLIPSWVVAPYAIQDASLTRRLYQKLILQIREQQLDQVYELEREVALVCVDMKARGVRVDLDHAARAMNSFEEKRDTILAKIKDLTGVNCSATDLRAIGRALRAENPNIELPQTTQGFDSIRKDFLESLKSPVADLVNLARKYDKAVGTFFQGYIFGHEVNGRIHADFHPLRRADEDGSGGTVSGRLACSGPNLQNVSARDPEIRDAVRGSFLPEEGERWVTFDYSSQEPRGAVHFAAAAKLRGAAEMVARFVKDPRTDLHQETAERMSIKRGDAKTINLAILYGAGGATICRRLGLPTEWINNKQGRRVEIAGAEGKRLISLHESSVPFMRALQKLAETTAKSRGYVKTILGRRGRFQKRGDEYDWTYMALNKVIQGSAADQMKMALILLRRAGIPTSLSIHDSAEFSIAYGAEGDARIQQIVDIMEHAIELKVPSVVDVKEATNWSGTK